MSLLDFLALLPKAGTVDLRIVPELEGAPREWYPIDARTFAVSPSLFRQIDEAIHEEHAERARRTIL